MSDTATAPATRIDELERENAALKRDIAMMPHVLKGLYAIREALGFNQYYPLSNLENDVRALRKQRDALKSACQQAEDYLDPLADVVDGSYGVPAPNPEMSILTEIREALGKSPTTGAP